LADPETGIEIVDISDPTSPQFVGLVPTTHGAFDMHIEDDILYLARHGAGVSVLDISNPRAPVLLSTINGGGEAWGVSGAGDILYVADLQEGVDVLDVSDPRAPRQIANEPGYAPHEIYFGEYIYLADQDQGLVILEPYRRP
jgi:hypothetical protein